MPTKERCRSTSGKGLDVTMSVTACNGGVMAKFFWTNPSDVLNSAPAAVVDGVSDTWGVLAPILTVLAAILGAIAVTWLLSAIFNRAFAKVPQFRESSSRAKLPFTIALASIAARIALNQISGGAPWVDVVNFVLLLALVAALAWLAIIALLIAESGLLYRYRVKAADARRISRLKTQVTLLRRIATAIIITLAVAAMLLTIPEVRALGAGILASAGLISVVAGLAVQSSLSNVFAGIQLAFTDAIRVDDVVVVNKDWGTVEEITLTYVVVALYDDRRLIIPSTFFTNTPFENWSRNSLELLGAVVLEVDWTVPVAELRSELTEILGQTELWDGRVGSLMVTDAVGGFVQLRALVSARDSSDVWDLRCLVREKLIDFIKKSYPQAMPRQRWQQTEVNSGPGAGTEN